MCFQSYTLISACLVRILRPINKLFSSTGFYDTGEEELPDYQPDFKKLRQDHLDGKMRDDIEQVI